MKFYIGLLTWLFIASTLVAGVVFAANGSFVMMGIGLIAFIAAFARYGCATH